MTLTIATGIAGIVAALTPLLLRYVHLDGLTMAGVSYLVALAVTVGAAFLAGDLHWDRASLLLVLGGSAGFWSVQQAVYKILLTVSPTLVRPVSMLRSADPIVRHGGRPPTPASR